MNEQLPTDLVQLDVLFQKARGEGINIQVAGQSMKRKFLLIVSGNYFSIALVNQYKLRRGEKTRKNLMLTVSGKTSCHSHCWLEDVIQLILPGLTGGNSGYAENHCHSL
uniref:Uncharacterized protein n=1 Tax=Populus trichocarpa TaxID=3694 RepID=A0A3N7FNP1_POPTR